MNFIALQNTFSEIELALFINGTLRTQRSASKIDASKDLIPFMQSMLDEHKLSLSDLSFMAINKGPGPYTTLRTLIATVNGISFATGIPLIGVDGLDALLTENNNPEFPITVALLNAFNNDVYYGISSSEPFSFESTAATTNNSSFYCVKNAANHASFLTTLAQTFPTQKINFIGDASYTYQEQIQKIFGNNAHFPLPQARFASLFQIGAIALHDFNTKKEISYQLQPVYLKKPMLFS